MYGNPFLKILATPLSTMLYCTYFVYVTTATPHCRLGGQPQVGVEQTNIRLVSTNHLLLLVHAEAMNTTVQNPRHVSLSYSWFAI